MGSTVAIIGGGYAGIAAAIDLTDRGIPVHLFEAAKLLGGRARRVTHENIALDNGQHILIGAYKETLDLIKRVHENNLNQLLYRLPFEITSPNGFYLKTLSLPAPLHLLGMMFSKGLTLKDKGAALSFFTKIKLKKFCLAQDQTVFQLLRTHNQTQKLIECLWEPLCIAALNTPIEKASAQIFLNALRDSLADLNSSEILIPKIDLSELLPHAAARYISSKKGIIEYSAPVLAIEKNNSGYLLQFKDRQLQFSHLICAVAPQHLARLTATLPELEQTTTIIDHYTYEPIYTLYFQYPENFHLPRPMILLDGNPGQWAFDRGLIGDKKGLISVVISASGKHQQLTHEELAEQTKRQLSRFWNLPKPIWQQIIAEKRATFTCIPNLNRPHQITPYPNFLLAGDYTESAYPATIEAAVRSGRKAAKYLIERT